MLSEGLRPEGELLGCRSIGSLRDVFEGGEPKDLGSPCPEAQRLHRAVTRAWRGKQPCAEATFREVNQTGERDFSKMFCSPHVAQTI